MNKKNLNTEQEQEALIHAIFYGSIDAVITLLKNGVNPNFQDNIGLSPLMIATGMGQADIVQVLIQENANPNMQDFDGSTALMMAAIRGDTKSVQALIHANADIKIQNKHGDAALMMAVHSGNTDVVKALLQAGADPYLKNNDGKTALDFAPKEVKEEMIEIFRQFDKTKQHIKQEFRKKQSTSNTNTQYIINQNSKQSPTISVNNIGHHQLTINPDYKPHRIIVHLNKENSR